MFSFPITYGIWIPAEILLYITVAYFSQKNNIIGGWKFMMTVIILGCIPLWAFIAPDSKNLALDGLLYDAIMVITLTSALIYFGSNKKFNSYNWLGLILIIVGLICMKI